MVNKCPRDLTKVIVLEMNFQSVECDRMPNFCPECGSKLTDSNVKFCSECGAKITPGSPSPNINQTAANEPAMPERKPVSEMSRLAGLKIEKYLMAGEAVNYATRGGLYVGGEEGLRGYVTNARVLFYASKGLLFKSDRLHEIPIASLGKYKIVEEGLILKTMYLQLNDLKIKGDRSDILDLYKAI
jgi:hypothetical protein